MFPFIKQALKKTLALVLFSIFALFSQVAFAQDASTTPVSTDGGPILANINVYESAFTQDENGRLSVSFTIQNVGDAVSGVMYGVRIVKDGKVVDERVYPAVLFAPTNEEIPVAILYEAPSYLIGEYDVFVIVSNQDGFDFGSGYAGKAVFSGTGEYLSIDEASCFLQVKDESGSPKYPITQSVDISADETLVAVCEVTNKFNKDISAGLYSSTRYRSIFGDIVPTFTVEPKNPAVWFIAGEKKSVSYIFPKVSIPQAYNLEFSLVDGVESKISNTVAFHFVLQGASATIQNISLDKDSYIAGDTAKVSVVWSPSADSFSGLRIATSTALQNGSLKVELQNGRGFACGDASVLLTAGGEHRIVSVPITADCSAPRVTVSILSGLGESTVVLAERTGVFEKPAKFPIMGFVYSGLFILACVLMYIYGRKDKKTTGVPLTVLFLSCLFIPAGDASAISFNIYTDAGGGAAYKSGGVNKTGSVTATLNKTIYNPGETITITASGKIFVSNERLYLAGKLNTDIAPINGSPEWREYRTSAQLPDNWAGDNIAGSSVVQTMSAPATPGNYGVDLKAVVTGNTFGHTIAQMGFTVRQPSPSVVIENVYPENVEPGQSASFTWRSDWASRCVATGHWSGEKPLSGSYNTGPLYRDSTYGIWCYGPILAGTSMTYMYYGKTVGVKGFPPTVDVRVSPQSVAYDGSVDVTTVVSGAAINGCVKGGSWSGTATNGTFVTRVNNIRANSGFTLTCKAPRVEIIKRTSPKESYFVEPTATDTAVVTVVPPNAPSISVTTTVTTP